MEKNEKIQGVDNASANNEASENKANAANVVDKATYTRIITECKLYRPTEGKKNFTFWFADDKAINAYVEDPDDGDMNVPGKVTKINVKLSQIMHLMRNGGAKQLTYLYTLAGNKFTSEVEAALTHATIKFTVNPHTPEDTYSYTDENGDTVENTYENYGCNFDIDYIIINKDIFLMSILAINALKTSIIK